MNDHRYISDGHLNWDLHFYHVSSPGGLKVFVEATNPKGEKVAFEMQKDREHPWRVLPPAPLWAFQKEELLLQLLLQA